MHCPIFPGIQHGMLRCTFHFFVSHTTLSSNTLEYRYGLRDLDRRELVEWADVVVASLNTIRALMLRGGRGLNRERSSLVLDHLSALSTVADAKENELKSLLENDNSIHVKLSKIFIVQEVLGRVRELFKI